MEKELLVPVITENVELDVTVDKLTLDVIKSEDFSKDYSEFAKFIQKANDAKKAVDEKVKELMTEEYLKSGEKKVDATYASFTLVAGSVRKSFNTSKFKEEHPDLYEQYIVESISSDSLRVKVK